MKMILGFIAMALLLGVNVHSTERVDDSWMSASYGSAGDQVIVEVREQITDYNTAKAHAYAVQSGEKVGDLAAAQEDCIKFALYSYVKAMYAAEMGRVAATQGRVASAVKAYKRALAFALAAQQVDHYDKGLSKSSKDVGATFESKSRVALKRLE